MSAVGIDICKSRDLLANTEEANCYQDAKQSIYFSVRKEDRIHLHFVVKRRSGVSASKSETHGCLFIGGHSSGRQ